MFQGLDNNFKATPKLVAILMWKAARINKFLVPSSNQPNANHVGARKQPKEVASSAFYVVNLIIDW